MCIRHGAKVKVCSSEGCTKKVVRGGVCWRHGAEVEPKLCSEKDVQILSSKDECALDMGQMSNDAAVKDLKYSRQRRCMHKAWGKSGEVYKRHGVN